MTTPPTVLCLCFCVLVSCDQPNPAFSGPEKAGRVKAVTEVSPTKSAKKPEEASPVRAPITFTEAEQREFLAALQAEANGEILPPDMAQKILAFYQDWGKREGLAAVTGAQKGFRAGITARTMEALAGWATSDPQKAMQWVEAFETEGFEKVLYISKVATTLGPAKMEDAVRWTTPHLGKPGGTQLISALYQTWSQLDRSAASNWLMKLPVAETSDQAINKIFSDWTAADPEEASKFLVTADKNKNRDLAIAAFAKKLMREDQISAEKWMEEISDQQIKLSVSRELTPHPEGL